MGRLALRTAALLRVVAGLVLIYFFLVGIQLMGSSLKLLGKGFAEKMITFTSNPFVGLFMGILLTSLVQSSSLVTSVVVVATQAGTITIRGAIPIIMGANIGTTVTNTLVSLSLITRAAEFRRAFPSAIVHDLFNTCTVVVLFPLELATHYLERLSSALTSGFAKLGGFKFTSVLELAVKPVSGTVLDLWGVLFGRGPAAGIGLIVFSLMILFAALFLVVVVLRAAVMARLEHFLKRYLFRNAVVAFLFGLILTSIVQSSSVTTSAIIPLVGAGLLTLRQIYPYTLGANIGTTVTALLACLVEAGKGVGGAGAIASPPGVTVALCHTFFNIAGTAIFYPLRIIPISVAEALGEAVTRKKVYAILYVLVLFYAIPLGLIVLSELLS